MVVAGLLADPGTVAAAQQISPLFDLIAGATFLDSTPWYLLLLCLAAYGLHPRHGARLATLFALTCGINEAAKLFFHLPRPYWVSSAVHAFSAQPSFGFPSGAAQYGVVFYGYIAAAARRGWVTIACLILLLAASAARIFAGIHFPLDILGGWVLGLVTLAAFLYLAPKIAEQAASWSAMIRYVLIVALAAVPVILAYLALAPLDTWQLPAAWQALALQQAGEPIDPARIYWAWGAAGIILGSLFGYEYLQRRGGWEPPSDPRRRITVILGGTATVFAISGVLTVAQDVVEPSLPPAAGNLLTVARMGIAIFWLIGGVPLLAGRAGYGQQPGNLSSSDPPVAGSGS